MKEDSHVNSNQFKKRFLRLLPLVAAGIFLYLLILYWPSLVNLFGMLVSAMQPIIVGFVIAYLLNILMTFYEKHLSKTKLSSRAAALKYTSMVLAIVTILAILTLSIQLVVPQFITCIGTLIQKAPAAIRNLLKNEYVNKLMTQDLSNSLSNINWNSLITKAQNLLKSGFTGGMNQIRGGLSWIMNLVLGIIFSIYLLSGKKTLLNQLERCMKAYIKPSVYKKLFSFGSLLNTNFHNYIVGQCIEAVILGTLCIIGMLCLRLPYATMIGVLVGITALIPVAGCYIGMAVGVIMIASISLPKSLVFLIFLIILQQIEGNLIYPRVVGSSVGLSGIWVLSAVTIFGALFGVAGMLVGVPITSTFYQIIREDVHKREHAAKSK